MRFITALMFFRGIAASFADGYRKLRPFNPTATARSVIGLALTDIEDTADNLIEGANFLQSFTAPSANPIENLGDALSQLSPFALSRQLDETGEGIGAQVTAYRDWCDLNGYPGNGEQDQLGDLFDWTKAQEVGAGI